MELIFFVISHLGFFEEDSTTVDSESVVSQIDTLDHYLHQVQEMRKQRLSTLAT